MTQDRIGRTTLFGGTAYLDLEATLELGSEPHFPLQKFKKFDDRVLIRFAQLFKARRDAARFAAVAKDGIAKRHGHAITHQQRLHTHAPQRSGAYSVGGSLKGVEGKVAPPSLVHALAIVFLYGYDDAVPDADVVQQEVTT
jgi:hypothetical protein